MVLVLNLTAAFPLYEPHFSRGACFISLSGSQEFQHSSGQLCQSVSAVCSGYSKESKTRSSTSLQTHLRTFNVQDVHALNLLLCFCLLKWQHLTSSPNMSIKITTITTMTVV